MGYFPFFIDITGKKGVIVGGGKVAARKVEKLLAFEPNLTVIAPRIEKCIRMQEETLSEDAADSLFLEEREFQIEDLVGADFVVAATDDEMLNGRISDYCKARRIPVNVVDDREKCFFLFPALVKEGSLTVGISTDGRSPVTASWVREEVSRIIPAGLGDIIDLLGQIRPQVLESDVPEAIRKDILQKMFLYCLEKGGEVTVEELVKEFIGW
ncbi:MAG: bifunctional precorrin-2 dehydrogenase/sirohydrochlorin ferrochelatase [Eubacterium sp.]|nr:bifunctional precorrin-2 dehydrogenase/sirohydrochlorin ferrochelatase [Eubacterium sp.]